MALLTVCQQTFRNDANYEEALEDVEALKVNIRECYSEISKTSEEIRSEVHETYLSKTDLETIQQDFQSSISQTASEIRMDFTSATDRISGDVAANQELLEQYIRFRGALIELGKVGNAFTAELSNDKLSFRFSGYHGHYGCWWVYVNITRKEYAYGMPGVYLAKPLGNHAITIEEFETIYSIYKRYEGKDLFVFQKKRFDYDE